MSDDGMDLCGAIWNHEMAMRRLLSLLRQSQRECTDIECFPQSPNNSNDDNGFMVMTLCWMALAFFLYMFRPSSIRNTENELKPERRGGNGEGGNPPPASPGLL